MVNTSLQNLQQIKLIFNAQVNITVHTHTHTHTHTRTHVHTHSHKYVNTATACLLPQTIAQDACVNYIQAAGSAVHKGNRTRRHLEEVIEEVRVLFQVEADGLVIHLHTADLDSHVLEQHMLPSNRAVVHHHHGSIVVLIVLHIQEDQLLPVVELLADTDEAGDVDACAEQLQVLH